MSNAILNLLWGGQAIINVLIWWQLRIDGRSIDALERRPS